MPNDPTILGRADDVTFVVTEPCQRGSCGCPTCNHAELDGKKMTIVEATQAHADHEGCACLVSIESATVSMSFGVPKSWRPRSAFDRFADLQRYGEDDNGVSGESWIEPKDDGEYLRRDDVLKLAGVIDAERDELLAALKGLVYEVDEQDRPERSPAYAAARALIARIEGGK